MILYCVFNLYHNLTAEVFQDSEEEKTRLSPEILMENAFPGALADPPVHVCTVNEKSKVAAVMTRLSVERYDHNINLTTVSGPQSLSAGYPALFPVEFHIKVGILPQLLVTRNFCYIDIMIMHSNTRSNCH